MQRNGTPPFVIVYSGVGLHELVQYRASPGEGGHVIGELSILSEWIPEQMEPGTIFVLENAGDVGDKEDPYWAVLSCPKCGQLGLVTRKQIAGLLPVICGSDKCPAQFFIRDEQIELRKAS